VTTGAATTDPDVAARRGRERRLVAAMFIAGACIYIQTYDAQAILPAIAADQHVTATASVMVLSATTVGMAVGVMPWAYLSDRIGRLAVIRICLVAATVLSLVGPWAPSFDLFLVMRLAKGLLFGGVTGLAVAFIFEQVAPVRAVIASGVYISGNTVGGVVTRVASGLIADRAGWRIALEAMAISGLLLAVAFLLMTRSFSDRSRRADALIHGEHAKVPLGRALWSSRTLLAFVQGFIALGVFNALFSVLPFQLRREFPDAGAVITSGLLALYGLAFVSAQSGGRLAGRFGIRRPLAAGYAAGFVGLALLLVPSMGALVVAVALVVLGMFIVHPLNSAEAGRRMPGHRAQSTALYQISWLAGATILGPIATTVYQAAGWGWMVFFLAAALACGFIAAVFDHRGAPPRRAEGAGGGAG